MHCMAQRYMMSEEDEKYFAGGGGGDDPNKNDPEWIKKMMDFQSAKAGKRGLAEMIGVDEEEEEVTPDPGWYSKGGKVFYTKYPGNNTDTGRQGSFHLYIYIPVYILHIIYTHIYIYIYTCPPPPTLPSPPSI